MEKMLVVVFDNEAKAYEGSRALNQLDAEGSISVHAAAVISRNSDGTLGMKQSDGDYPIRTLGGTALGSLVGILGGPAGVALGAAAGGFAGLLTDLRVAGVDGEFLDEVSKALTPGKCAIVADVNEEWVTPVDSRMEAIGGQVHRAARSGVEAEQVAREQEKIRAELASLKNEYTRAQAERKTRLQSRIDQMNAKLQSKQQRDQQQREQLKREMDTKLQAVQQRAAKAQGNAKTALEARISDLRRELGLSKAKQSAASAPDTHH
jgi:uncharacterized membrane protein